MTTFTVELDTSGIEDAFDRLVPEMDRQLHTAMEAATVDVANEAKQRAPKDTSRLVNSITPMPVEGSFSAGTLEGGVTATAPHAMHVEYGTGIHGLNREPFEIVPKRMKALRWPARGGRDGWAFAKRVLHPGAPAQPYLHPAWESKRGSVIESFRKAVQVAIAKSQKG